MTLDEYFKQHPEAENYREYLSRYEGMLQFNEETACIWGGPFPGGFASYFIKDYNSIKHWKDPSKTLAEANSIYMEKNNITYIDFPTKEKPIALYLAGNDDASYSKYFATAEEAEQELKSLLVKQPLDFFNDLGDVNGWVFTN